MTTSTDTTISDALSHLTADDRANATRALKTPDLYPARRVAEFLSVPIPAVHAWRKDRNIKKANS